MRLYLIGREGVGPGQRVEGGIFCHSGERVNIFGSALVNFDRQSRARLGRSVLKLKSASHVSRACRL